MPLETSCEIFKGQLVFVLPTIGYGWSRRLPGTPISQPGDSIEPPPPFNARILEFHYFNGGIRGGIAIIEHQSHSLNSEWIGFCVRDGMGTLTFNLLTNPTDYNIRIGNTKPVINIDPEKLPMPEWIQFQGSPFMSGLGYIVDLEMPSDAILKRIRKNQDAM
jgi:hypothetical protein